MFATYHEMGVQPEELPNPALRAEFADWLKDNSGEEDDE
jgi:hypothetical protein